MKKKKEVEEEKTVEVYHLNKEDVRDLLEIKRLYLLRKEKEKQSKKRR